MKTTKHTAIERERTAVLRLELDYELAVLFDAMNDKNENLKVQTKQKIERIRQELVRLKAL